MIAGVSGEAFVAAIARERDGDVAAGELGHQECRNLRGVRERLVIDVRQALDDVARRLRLDDKLGVLGAEMLGDAARVIGFVEFPVAKADGKCMRGLRRLRLHQRDDGRGIDAAGQERAERNIGDHLPADRVAQQALQLIGKLDL